MARTVLLYALAFALAAAALEWLKFRYVTRIHSTEIMFTFIEIAPAALLVSLVSAALLRNPKFLPARVRPDEINVLT